MPIAAREPIVPPPLLLPEPGAALPSVPSARPSAVRPATARRGPVGPLPDWRLQRVQALVEARLAEPLTLAEMAAAAGVSRMHFAAQFRVATGMRPHDYLLGRRVLRAMAQMTASDAPLADLALDVGFQSQSHFSTVFKRLTGTTPATWRRDPRPLPSAASHLG